MATKEVSDDFEGHDDEEEAGAGERGKPQPKPSVKADEDGNVIVGEAEPQTRKDRRAAYKKHEEEARLLREQNAVLQRQMNDLHTNVLSRLAPASAQQVPAGGQDPFSAYMTQLDERQEMVSTLFNMPNLPAEQKAQYRKQYYEINRERDRAVKLAAKQEALQEFQQAQAQRPAENGMVPLIQAEYPEVVGYRGPDGRTNPAFEFADASYRRMIARGAPATMATVRKAMDETVAEFQLRPAQRPAASDVERQRMGGIPAQAGARTGSREITLSGEQQRMARVNWPDLSENEAYAKLAELLRRQDREGSAA